MDEINAVYYACPNCGSTDLRHDADAEWNMELQMWEIKAVYDHTVCDACGHKINDPDIKHVVTT